MGSDLAAWAHKLQGEHGDMFETYYGSQRTIWLGRADLAAPVLASSTKNNYFNRGVSSPGMREIAELYLNTLGGEIPVDMSKFWFRFFVDSMHLSATGKPAHAMAGYYNTLVPKNKQTDHPKELLDATEEIIFSIKNEFFAASFMFFFPPFIRHYILRHYNTKYVNQVKRFNEILLSIIRRRKAEINATPIGEPLNPDMLTLLLTTNTPRDLEIISTGDITRPMAEDEIRSDPMKSIPFESLDRLKYTEAFIKEVLRLNPVLPFLWKMATNDDTLGGMRWKAGTSVFINVYGTQTHPNNWENPEKFMPARHLEGYKMKADRNAYIPFGGGPRLCPGKNFAMATLKLLTALFFRRFDIELADKKAPLKTSFTMVRHCDELKVYIRPKIPIAG
ncbi:13321_t:CDS:2 [Racocetra fulgida]|uniref:13321_t:CDS:1 n=1 Tax=Racocetra fulgida TaxID=60492 RepID=A0A9N8VS15_9GLOM|nr:13321_t:CDS:2 [Racocetra fulgida]